MTPDAAFALCSDAIVRSACRQGEEPGMLSSEVQQSLSAGLIAACARCPQAQGHGWPVVNAGAIFCPGGYSVVLASCWY